MLLLVMLAELVLWRLVLLVTVVVVTAELLIAMVLMRAESWCPGPSRGAHTAAGHVLAVRGVAVRPGFTSGRNTQCAILLSRLTAST